MKIKYAIYLVLGLLLLNMIRKKVMDAAALKQLLLLIGFPPDTVNLFVAQAAFESGGLNFSSAVNKADNNLTGIMFLNKPFQRNATKGTQMPLADTGGKAGYYAHFPTLKDWAIDYKRILSFGAKPIEAKDPIDLAKRLKQNGYFGGNEQQYAGGVSKYFSKLT